MVKTQAIGGIVIIIIIIAIVILFRKNIEGFFKDLGAGLQNFGEDVGKGATQFITEQLSQAVGDAGAAVLDSVDDIRDTIFQAGQDARTNFDNVTADISEQLQSFFNPNPTVTAASVEDLNKTFSDHFGVDIEFSSDTTVNPDTGVIESSTPPTFIASEEDIAAVQELQDKIKEELKKIQEVEMIDEVSNLTTPQSFRDR